MDDFNFFDEFDKGQQPVKRSSKHTIIILALFLAAIAFCGYTGFSYMAMLDFRAEVEELERRRDDPALDQRIAQYSVIADQLARVSTDRNALRALGFFTRLNHTAGSSALNLISNNQTDNIILNDMVMGPNNITLEVLAIDKEAVARFAATLRETGYFKYIMVDQISEHDTFLDLMEEFELDPPVIDFTITMEITTSKLLAGESFDDILRVRSIVETVINHTGGAF